LTIGSRPALFASLSRLPHVALDVATPSMAALLWAGGWPPLAFVARGLLTAFCGYAAVYALNDLVDLRANRASLPPGGPVRTRSLDSAAGRHPMATGMLSVKAGAPIPSDWSDIEEDALLNRGSAKAAAAFHVASFYPLAVLIIVGVKALAAPIA
jgi:hypothetical protein